MEEALLNKVEGKILMEGWGEWENKVVESKTTSDG